MLVRYALTAHIEALKQMMDDVTFLALLTEDSVVA